MGAMLGNPSGKIIDLAKSDNSFDNQGVWNNILTFHCSIGTFDYVEIHHTFLLEDGQYRIALSPDGGSTQKFLSPQTTGINAGDAGEFILRIYRDSSMPSQLTCVCTMSSTDDFASTFAYDSGITENANITIQFFNNNGVVYNKTRVFKIIL